MWPLTRVICRLLLSMLVFLTGFRFHPLERGFSSSAQQMTEITIWQAPHVMYRSRCRDVSMCQGAIRPSCLRSTRSDKAAGADDAPPFAGPLWPRSNVVKAWAGKCMWPQRYCCCCCCCCCFLLLLLLFLLLLWLLLLP
ncbi:unnamed protein product [Polarella glacialis]|uniref:Secreted protein n=1 Tax=Polarella glacialis TaxID=89957 RepID=A0A813JSF0_POLGL|nr:unnamed protein product [Polarella glacialis]